MSLAAKTDTTPEHVQHVDRMADAVRLRIAGASYRAIAQALGCAVSTAHDLVAEALRNYATELTETADQALHLELQRRDEEYRIAYTLATDTKKDENLRLRAIDRCIRISERRSRLLGLDAPERHEFSGPAGGTIPIEIRSELAGYSDDQLDKLDRELASFAAGADAQRQIIEHREAAMADEANDTEANDTQEQQQAGESQPNEAAAGRAQVARTAAETGGERQGASHDQRSIVERAEKK